MTFRETRPITSLTHLENLFLSQRRRPRVSTDADETVATVVAIGVATSPADSGERIRPAWLLPFVAPRDNFAEKLLCEQVCERIRNRDVNIERTNIEVELA